MVGIIDYNMGNVSSISNMLKKIGEKNIITNDLGILSECDRLILPGVGSFDNGINNLRILGLDEFLVNKFHQNIPILGICLGMQLFAKNSEEGNQDGLGLVDGDVVSFKGKIEERYKIPHMGWNYANFLNTDYWGNSQKNKFYFVHSYYLSLYDSSNILCEAKYGINFCAGFKVKNLIGVQFHPEKSHKYGIEFLSIF
ncbi:MAG: imidazole glycerol phosphate synthase subunit HisH [Cytophagaceae bacterium]|nr:imidazole glycerol phosphate synthase subunit HisH [Cytophagaceae bacterium]